MSNYQVIAAINAKFHVAHDRLESIHHETTIPIEAHQLHEVVALLLEAHPDWSPAQVFDALRSTASRADAPDNSHGYGLVDALAALNPPRNSGLAVCFR